MIDEKKLIERLWERHRDVQSNYDYSNEEAEIICNNICNIVSIIDVQQQVDKWIPCDERLPDIEKKVLVTIWCHRVEQGFLSRKGKWFVIADDGINEATVIAWKPLPKPYKKEGGLDE